MEMELPYTTRQVARGSRPDAVRSDGWYLIKRVPLMRLTCQVRLPSCLAQQNSARLVVMLPSSAYVSEDMQAFVQASPVTIQRANR